MFLISAEAGILAETIRFNRDANFVYSKYAYGPIDYVEFDGKRIPATPANKPCAPDKDCWKEIKGSNYYIATGPLQGPHASVTVEPAVGVGGNPYIFAYKKQHVPRLQKDDHVIFTGRMGNRQRKVFIKFKGGTSYALKLVPTAGTWKAVVTFVDNTQPLTSDNSRVMYETLRFNKNGNYVYSKYAYGPVDYVEFDGKRIPATPANKPCAPDNDCWKEIKKTQYYIFEGRLRAPLASITVEPAADVGGHPYHFVYKKPNAQ
ncbi:unnamed protein product [Dibothriocephalus latus]|uniref:Uncharacterized protein n=1 Tax=Dibothriocephalus latus TaxID=60516 RepID=A0A3P6TRI5_DIBLA|nr:unnamed protein product [Dibothriocephalus latus]